MSKKRLFGLSKWRLGKLEDDYKSHKQNKKGLNYLHCEDNVIKLKSKKRYPCKKGKGEHKFKIIDINKSIFSGGKFLVEKKCIVCGKKEIEFKKYE